MLVSPRKSQVSVEFILLLSILVLLLVFLMGSYSDKMKQVQLQKERFEARKILKQIGSTINSIYLAGNGSSKEIYVSEDILGVYNYTLDFSLDNHFIFIKWDTGYFSYPLITSKILFTDLNNTKYTIINNEGVVSLT